MMAYRKDIDGLRALAVLPALFFHAGFKGFDGGYVGIEIFFVVSGYLITSIILNEQSKEKFSLINFYERRARRILPALTVVLVVTTLVAYLLMPAYLLKWYSQSLLAVSLFYSNAYFFFTTGYFDPNAGEQPLLHMWSLAVEEQYYFIYPLFLMLFHQHLRKLLPWVVLLLTLASLAFAQYLANMGYDKLNYYHTSSRTWELMAGALIVFFALDKKNYPAFVTQFMPLLGFLMIVFAVVIFDKHTPYPGLLTLVPVLGTCFIIIFANKDTYVSRFLSLRPVVLIGLMSYSVYLWHHPVYAFLRMKTIGPPSFEAFVVAVGVSLLLGFLSWKFVEVPFRDKQRFTRKQIFSYAFASILVLVSVAYAGKYFEGFKQRFSLPDYEFSTTYSEKRVACHTRGKNYLKPEKACEYFGDNVEWAVLGDSHSVEFAHELARRLEERNIGIKHFSFSDCPPAMLFESVNPGCTEWFRESVSYLVNNHDIQHVVLTYRHSRFLFGEHRYTYPLMPDENPNYLFEKESRKRTAQAARALYWKSFKATVDQLLEAGKTVYILYPVPELPKEFRTASMPMSVFSDETLLDLDKTTPVGYYFERQSYILEKLAELNYSNRIIKINPLPAFCDGQYCSALKEGQALYIDDDHPSLFGAKRIVNLMDI